MAHVQQPERKDTIYLRPSPKSRPVRYIEGIEESGIMLDAKHAIAMYTSRAIPNVGPQGPPGDNANSLFDTIIASASDEFTPISTGGPKTTFRAPYALELATGYVRISLTNAPIGSDFIVDITVNGASLFTTQIRIDAGQKTSVGSATPEVYAFTAIPDDAEFLVFVTQVGSTTAGTGLKVAVTGIKVE